MKREKSLRIWLSILALAALSLALGIWAGPLVDGLTTLVSRLGG